MNSSTYQPGPSVPWDPNLRPTNNSCQIGPNGKDENPDDPLLSILIFYPLSPAKKIN
jgi:hypothetical protein